MAIHRCITASLQPDAVQLPETEGLFTAEEEAAFASEDEQVILDFERSLAAAFNKPPPTRDTRFGSAVGGLELELGFA